MDARRQAYDDGQKRECGNKNEGGNFFVVINQIECVMYKINEGEERKEKEEKDVHIKTSTR